MLAMIPLPVTLKYTNIWRNFFFPFYYVCCSSVCGASNSTKSCAHTQWVQ